MVTGSEQLKTKAATHVARAYFTLPGLQHKKHFFYCVMASEPALSQVAMRVSTSPLRLVTRIWPLPSKQTPLGRRRMRISFACIFINVGSSSSVIILKITQFGVWSV